jgi:biopolymer transport protein ExbD
MGKLKIKKSDVWIDMTPMSDVMVLLLTFFMLSSNFVKNEAVKVITPQSEVTAKVPTSDVLDITIDPAGRVLMSTDKTSTLQGALDEMLSAKGMELTNAQKKKFLDDPQFGLPMSLLKSYLDLDVEKMGEQLRAGSGIPTDSINGGMSEFQMWVKFLKQQNKDLKLCIKADQSTPYVHIKKVMHELQDMSENRYQLLTSYKKAED